MKNYLIVISVLMALFGFILVDHHRDMPNQIQQQRNTLLGGGSGAAERTKPVGRINVASAKSPSKPVPAKPAQVATAAAPTAINGQQVYQSGCVACHGTGVAGAPKVGDANMWTKRIAKGTDTLYASAINGMKGSQGFMPAKGGNAALSDAEVKAAVDYMLAKSK